MTSRKMERAGTLGISRRAANSSHSTHPLVNPAPVSLMDQLARHMFSKKHRDDLASWQTLDSGPVAAAT